VWVPGRDSGCGGCRSRCGASCGKPSNKNAKTAKSEIFPVLFSPFAPELLHPFHM